MVFLPINDSNKRIWIRYHYVTLALIAACVLIYVVQQSGGEDANPNGSARNIAGLFNEAGNVLGMMPHPERLADARLGGCDGKSMLDGLVGALA